MRTPSENSIRPRRSRLADLENQASELERRLAETRASLNRELSQLTFEDEPFADELPEAALWVPADGNLQAGPGRPGGGHDGWDAAVAEDHEGGRREAADRTEALVSHGRHDAYHRGFPARRHLKVAAGAAAAAAAGAVLAVNLSGGSAGWPASVTTVQREVTQACQNPDVKAEPSQVDFACAKSTRQILWVFALMTSIDNPRFHDPRTGRLGLEPITPGLGGQVAWSLNLHHPYNPLSPADSIQVAARAINNIIAGASFTGPRGNTVVQTGLEGSSANCARYTGSGAVITQQGFPSLCAKPVTAPGQAALVADVYRKWIIGATPQAARAAAVLFVNARDPGNPQVQAILKQVMRSRWAA